MSTVEVIRMYSTVMCIGATFALGLGARPAKWVRAIDLLAATVAFVSTILTVLKG